MSTLSDVAARAGVSVSAVSRVLSGAASSRVSGATRQRIEEAARELDYHPNFAARALKFSRTNVIALVVPDVTNAIFAELMRGVDEAAAELGLMVLLARAESMHSPAGPIAKLVGEGRVDGLLIQLGDAMTAHDLAGVLTDRVPAVLINSRREDHVGSVILPDEAGVAIAVQHLVSLGHTRIGLVNGLPGTDSAARRGAGFDAAMEAAGLAIVPELVTRLGYEPQQGRAALRVLTTSPAPPTAIVVANVNAALGVLGEARQLGIRVPEDLSIVAIHDAWTADHSWPPLTTVRMPLYELGKRSMSAISARIKDDVIEDLVVSDPAPLLVMRESTRGIT
jgi:LacI family transcriptional regulator